MFVRTLILSLVGLLSSQFALAAPIAYNAGNFSVTFDASQTQAGWVSSNIGGGNAIGGYGVDPGKVDLATGNDSWTLTFPWSTTNSGVVAGVVPGREMRDIINLSGLTVSAAPNANVNYLITIGTEISGSGLSWGPFNPAEAVNVTGVVSTTNDSGATQVLVNHVVSLSPSGVPSNTILSFELAPSMPLNGLNLTYVMDGLFNSGELDFGVQYITISAVSSVPEVGRAQLLAMGLFAVAGFVLKRRETRSGVKFI